jgi:RNA polymerase sigma-70 factor (ECF subfamily)
MKTNSDSNRNFSVVSGDYLSERKFPRETPVRALELETDERQLIEAAQRDPLRFAELYESNFERVYAFVAYRVRDREEAQDLTAEIFHQALAGIQRFEWQGKPFVAWLLGIAAKVLADRWERLGKRQEVPSDEVEEAAIEAVIEQRAMLFQLVDALPADQRRVIIRRFVDQRSVREIAQELGRSEGAVKQLQFRALQTLRSQMRSKYV